MKAVSVLLSLMPMLGHPMLAEEITPGTPLEVAPGIRGAVELTFASMSGTFYQVEFSENLVNWDREGYSVKGTGGQMAVMASTRGKAKAFYRLRTDGDPLNAAPSSPPTAEDIIAALGYAPLNPSGVGVDEETAQKLRDALSVSPEQNNPLPLTMSALIQDRSRNDRCFRLAQMVFGDSYGPDLGEALDARVAVNRGGGMSLTDTTVTNGIWSTDFTRSLSGAVCVLGNGGTLTFPKSSTGASCYRLHVFYISENGGGSFRIEHSENGGAFGDLPANATYTTAPATASNPIDTNNGGAIRCDVLSYDFPSTKPRRLKLTVTSGTVRVLGMAWSDCWDGAKGGTQVYNLSGSGQTVQDMARAPQTCFDTILKTLKPHFGTFKVDDNAQQMASLPAFLAKIQTAWPMDMVLVSSHPVYSSPENSLTDADKVLRAVAAANGHSFVNIRSAMPSYDTMRPIGYLGADNYHLSNAGGRYQTEIIMRQLSAVLKEAHLLGGVTNSVQSTIERGPRWFENQTGVAGNYLPGTNYNLFDAANLYDSAVNPVSFFSMWRQSDGNVMFSTGGLGRLQLNSSGRFFLGGGTDGFGYPQFGGPGRGPAGRMEIHVGNQLGDNGLVLSGRSGQSGDLLRLTKDSGVSAGGEGTRVGGVKGNGEADFPSVRVTAMPTYSTHSAADADSKLGSGGLYKLNGARTVYQKP